MSYQNDLFIDNCVMRLVQIASAIRQNCERSEQNNDRLACQEFDRMEKEFDAEEIECQEIDATDNA